MEYLKKAKPVDGRRQQNLEAEVHAIIRDVAVRGDEALIEYNTQFDGNTRTGLRISPEEIRRAYELTSPALIEDLKTAAQRLEDFAVKQKASLHGFTDYEISPGIFLGQNIIPVDSCCCYVPGGGYPLYSTALMMGITARTAGVRRIAMCTPAVNGTDSVHPSTLVAMDIAGIHEIYALSGAHAIAAFACGTKQIQPVDMIVGPGNQYVTEAKRQCYGRIGIDFLAGPSEILVIADRNADPSCIAADLLSESEHDPQAIARLITTDRELGLEVIRQVEKQLPELETEDIASASWNACGEVILADSLEDACRLANAFAPEHLVLQFDDALAYTDHFKNYGSLFIGKYSAVVYSDYVNGINHTLPTGKAARYSGGVWIGTFSRVCTTQRLTKEAAQQISGLASHLAEGEGFPGHANAASIRMKT